MTTGLRPDSVSFVASLGQTVGVLAPSAGLAVVIPLVFAKAGNATWAIFAAILVGFIFLVAIFRMFASRSASAGGLGSFGALAFGGWGGILVSWVYLVTLVYSISAGASAAVYYADLLIRDLTGLNLTARADLLLLAATFAVAVGVAYRGIRFSTDLMLAIECLSIGGIVVLVSCAFLRQPRWLDPPQVHLGMPAVGQLPLAFVVAFFCLSGFETVTSLGEEAHQAARTIPRVIACCIAPVGLLYIAVSYGLVAVFRHAPTGLDQTAAPFELLARMVGVPWLGTAVSIGIWTSFFAAVLGCTNAGARIFYDLSRKGDFWTGCARVDAAHGSPLRAIVLMAFLGAAGPAVLLGTGSSLTDCIAYLTQLSCLAYVATYGLIAVAAPVFLFRANELKAFDLMASAAAMVILAAVAVMNVYPVPAWPWNVLPYVFVFTTVLGIAATAACRLAAARPR